MSALRFIADPVKLALINEHLPPNLRLGYVDDDGTHYIDNSIYLLLKDLYDQAIIDALDVETPEEFFNMMVGQCPSIDTAVQNTLLRTDYTQLADSPFPQEQREIIATFRQELRDINHQLNYPREVTWPYSGIEKIDQIFVEELNAVGIAAEVAAE